MTIYVVDRSMPEPGPETVAEQLAGMIRSIVHTSEQVTAAGKPVVYLRTLFLPDDARCLCLFEAPTPKIVQEVYELAQVSFTRIMQAQEIAP